MNIFQDLSFFNRNIFWFYTCLLFFLETKVKDWFFYYSSSGRIVSHITEPRYTLINKKDTISDYLSVQQLFTELENRKE